MAEVIDFRTGQVFSLSDVVSEEVKPSFWEGFHDIRNLFEAIQNDKIRKNLQIRDLDFSFDLKCKTNDLDNSVLKSICDQVRYSQYRTVNFGSISSGVIAPKTRQHFENTRSGGLLHAGEEQVVSVVWLLENTRKKAKLLTAEEFFRN